MDKDYITLDDQEAFDKVETKNAFVYVNKTYKGPECIDATIRKKFDEWKVVKSANNLKKDGLPCGQFLCRDEKSLREVCENIDNPIVSDYDETH